MQCAVSAAVAVMKSGKKVVCGSQSGVLAIWSWGYWNDCSDRFPGHPESVDAVIKWDEDTLITGSSDGAVRVINVLPNKLLGVIGEHAEDMPVERLALSADMQLLASMSHDNCVKLWDMSVLQDNSDGEQELEQDDEQQQQQQGIAGEGERQEAAVATAGALAASKQRQRQPEGDTSCGSDGGADDSDADASSDEQQQHRSRNKRRKHEKTAMKGQGKPSKASNFFADLL